MNRFLRLEALLASTTLMRLAFSLARGPAGLLKQQTTFWHLCVTCLIPLIAAGQKLIGIDANEEAVTSTQVEPCNSCVDSANVSWPRGNVFPRLRNASRFGRTAADRL